MRLVADPAAIDVLLTENLFGDILSDEAAVLAGSLGTAALGLASATGPGCSSRCTARRPTSPAGASPTRSAPSPVAAMLLRYGLELPEAAAAVDQAVAAVLAAGARTADIARPESERSARARSGTRSRGWCSGARRWSRCWA